MLIDEFLPEFDVSERHELAVRAPADAVYRALCELDLGRSRRIRWLFALRGLRRRGLTLSGLTRLGFVRLGERPGEELLLGIVGRFWTPSGHLRRLDPEGFRAFAEPSYAKAVWNFSVVGESGGGAWLATETRVACLGPASRRRFRVYWAVVAVFSRWIRREALRLVREDAERGRGRRSR